MQVTLADNNYGKSRVRLVHVRRQPEQHEVKDLTVSVRFAGDFEPAYRTGDNSSVLPTDTMKNTVYVMARQHPPDHIEEFALRLVDHFLRHNPAVSEVSVDVAERLWARIRVGDQPHRWAFVAHGGGEKRTALVTGSANKRAVWAGLEDLAVLKTSGSGFQGFLKDSFTTLAETSERIFATLVRARWLYASGKADFAASWTGVRQVLLETFAGHESRSVQHTLYAMGEAVLRSFDQVAEIELSLPNRHHLPVDLTLFGLDNNQEVFVPTEEPYGLIEARLARR